MIHVLLTSHGKKFFTQGINLFTKSLVVQISHPLILGVERLVNTPLVCHVDLVEVGIG